MEKSSVLMQEGKHGNEGMWREERARQEIVGKCWKAEITEK